MPRASLERKPSEVAAMFDRTAARYDLLNDVLSVGQDRLWRRAVARAVGARRGELVLDLAAGTGTSSRAFAGAAARCVACDFSLGMLRVGTRRSRMRHTGEREGPAFVAGDALALPFDDGVFDAVTISFGLRNVADVDLALAEMLRVTRPGGRLVACEFSTPPNRILEWAYAMYNTKILPRVARLGSNPDAYAYLSESIGDWPDQAALARRLRAAGWGSVAWRDLSLGIVALHRARSPDPLDVPDERAG